MNNVLYGLVGILSFVLIILLTDYLAELVTWIIEKLRSYKFGMVIIFIIQIITVVILVLIMLFVSAKFGTSVMGFIKNIFGGMKC